MKEKLVSPDKSGKEWLTILVRETINHATHAEDMWQVFSMLKTLGFPSRSQLAYLGDDFDQLQHPTLNTRSVQRAKREQLESF